MTSGQVALMPSPSGRLEASLGRGPARLRPGARMLGFSLLSAYGTVRWATLISGSEDARLLGMLIVAVVVAAAGTVVAGRRRLLVIPLAVIALAALFALAGLPLRWVVHARVAVIVSAVGQGLSALPTVLVPYKGFELWVRAVILLGAGVLLLDAALMLAVLPRSLERLRAAAAALPLLALAAVPAALVHPQLPYADGVVLFALLAMLLWGERISARLAGTLTLITVAAVAAGLAAPALDHDRPWLDFQALASRLESPSEHFDWTQGYGPISWPRDGRTVLDVKASRADYWKAENLDTFDGHGWAAAADPPPGDGLDGVPPGARRRWTQTLGVSVGAVRTPQVIAAGVAAPPSGLPGAMVGGASPGTWLAISALGPGDSYRVRVYDPQPSVALLARAGTGYPAPVSSSELTVEVPQQVPSPDGSEQAAVPVALPAFGSSAPQRSTTGAASLLEASPYAGAYSLSRRLLRGARTPYAYVVAVMRLLSHGYAYNEDPPASRYPVETFLISSKAGYCQQFAGAMALLLRLGGVPARVAVGFTTGAYDSGTSKWMVTDTDAHAWVEAFFPRYGWVRFDPTPAADPALATVPRAIGRAGLTPPKVTGHGDLGAAGARTVSAHARRARGSSGAAPLAIAAAASVLALAAAVGLLGPLKTPRARLDELERAFARTGRPLAARSTLQTIEQRLNDWPQAAAYVRALRLERYGGAEHGPSAADRRVLRRALAAGLGPIGKLRAVWALPPRRGR